MAEAKKHQDPSAAALRALEEALKIAEELENSLSEGGARYRAIESGSENKVTDGSYARDPAAAALSSIEVALEAVLRSRQDAAVSFGTSDEVHPLQRPISAFQGSVADVLPGLPVEPSTLTRLDRHDAIMSLATFATVAFMILESVFNLSLGKNVGWLGAATALVFGVALTILFRARITVSERVRHDGA